MKIDEQDLLRLAQAREILQNLNMAWEIAQNALKQADLVQNGPDSVEKPLKTTEIEDVGETCEYIAKIVVYYRDRLVSYGMEANLAGSLAKDLSGRLWSDVLEESR